MIGGQYERGSIVGSVPSGRMKVSNTFHTCANSLNVILVLDFIDVNTGSEYLELGCEGSQLYFVSW